MSTFDKVKEVIVDKLGVEEDKIETSSSFVDDLGAERTSDWVIERINVLLDRRLREGKKTMVTTNLLTLGEVGTRYGARTASRLGGYRWHECTGKDYRLL